MEGRFESAETPPGKKEFLLLKVRQGGGVESADRFETPHGLGMILGNELGATLGMLGGFAFTHRPDLPVLPVIDAFLARPLDQCRRRSMD